ncbi:MAG: alpha/beta hydrolase [Myxococcota bacterium]|nr:alpha/beta hydrolase [Myxococcota bacterium]
MRTLGFTVISLALLGGGLLGCGGEAPASPATVESSDGDAKRSPLEAARAAFEAARGGKTCEVPREGETRTDGPYIYAEPAGKRLHLDLTRPTGPGPHPVAVLFHGGAFQGGDEDHLARLGRRLGAAGWAAARVEYRLAGREEPDFPAPVADARCAVRFLRAEAADLGLDPDRVVAIGFSAGGHLAAALALQADDARLDGECGHGGRPDVRGAVAFYPPLDIRPEVPWDPSADALFTRFLGKPRDEARELATLASPVAAAGEDDPPLLVITAEDDAIVPPEVTEHALASLADAPHAHLEQAGVGHGFGVLEEEDPPESSCAVLAYLDAL